MDDIRDYEKVAMKVSKVSIAANFVLTVLKLLAGVIAHSSAMISDAIHSASDVFSTVVVIVGIRISSKASDKDHPYGHERMECVAAIVLATILAATGLGIGYSAVGKIAGGDYAQLAVPGMLALAAALLSIVVKEGMYTPPAAPPVTPGHPPARQKRRRTARSRWGSSWRSMWRPPMA